MVDEIFSSLGKQIIISQNTKITHSVRGTDMPCVTYKMVALCQEVVRCIKVIQVELNQCYNNTMCSEEYSIA